MKIRTVIFDLDGTLLDTLADLTDAINFALASVGRNAIDISDVRKFVGNGVPKLVERALRFTGGEPEARLVAATLAAFTEYYDVHSADKTAPYAGTAELIAALKARGIKTAVVTNKYDGAARALKPKFFPTIDFVVGTSDNIRPKPSSDGVNSALAALGASIDTALYVGDGETDIATARNAGLPVAAVTWGFRDREILVGLKPDWIIDRPEELLTIIDGKDGEK